MKGHLATLVPALSRVRLPFIRDRAFIYFVILNELLLGMEIYLAHSLNGTVRFREWIPTVCGPMMGLTLLAALFLKQHRPRLAIALAWAVSFGSAAVGVLGTYYHLVRAILPTAAPGQRVSLELLVWGAPMIAPLSFVLVAALCLLATAGHGMISRGSAVSTAAEKPWLSREQGYFLLACMGALIALVSSVFDHLRGGFTNPWLWIPTASGVFAAAVAFILALIPSPNRGDLTIYTAAMVLLCCVGPLGVVLHILHDLGVGGAIVVERFLKGAPVMAPMVFANCGLLGLLVLLDPDGS